MKKLLVSALGVLAIGTMAMGAGFILPAEITIDQAVGYADVDVIAAAGPAIAGANVYLIVDAPFEIHNVHMGDVAGMLFYGNNTGEANVFTVDNGGAPATECYASTTTNTGTVTPDGVKPVCKLRLTIPAGTPIGTSGHLTTDYPGAPSDFGAGPEGLTQATAVVKVIPEPASMLFLLAGLPLLRRRH